MNNLGHPLPPGPLVFLSITLLALLIPAPQALEGMIDVGPSDSAILKGNFATAIVMDAATGEVLVAKRPDDQRQPASMTKMMTELLIMERIAEGDIALADQVTVSARASRMGGSQVYLKDGEVFTVEELLMALAIHSGNDAAVALAEYHAGTVEAFIELMNLRATELNMRATIFHSVHGLPPGWRQKPDLTSAYDMALLGRELSKHPQALKWASMKTAPFRDGEFTLYNSNKLIGTFRGLDGLKTGYHHRAGFCLTATAIQKGQRLIAVVMGATDNQARSAETARLLSYAFNLYTHVTLITPENQTIAPPLPIEDGEAREITLAYAEPMSVSVRKDQVDLVILEKRISEPLAAPIEAGEVVGTAVALLNGRTLGEVPIVAAEPVARGSLLQRIMH